MVQQTCATYRREFEKKRRNYNVLDTEREKDHNKRKKNQIYYRFHANECVECSFYGGKHLRLINGKVCDGVYRFATKSIENV